MKIALFIGYLTTILLGSFCPMQIVAAMPMSESMQHMEMNEKAMTSMVSMTLAVPMMSMKSADPASDSVPMSPSGNCTTVHCIGMSQSNQEPASIAISAIHLVGSAGVPPPIPSIPIVLESLPAPPNTTNVHLARIISIIVLRV